MFIFVTSCVLFYYVCIAVLHTLVAGRSCNRPPWHRFFLVSLGLKANAEMVPKTPSCYCMLLM